MGSYTARNKTGILLCLQLPIWIIIRNQSKALNMSTDSQFFDYTYRIRPRAANKCWDGKRIIFMRCCRTSARQEIDRRQSHSFRDFCFLIDSNAVVTMTNSNLHKSRTFTENSEPVGVKLWSSAKSKWWGFLNSKTEYMKIPLVKNDGTESFDLSNILIY